VNPATGRFVCKVVFVHERVVIKVKKADGSQTPVYMSEHAACADVFAAGEAAIKPGETALVPTGLFFEIPEGYEIQVRPRSGLPLKHGIIVPNSPGTIDADYRGEFKVILMNLGKEEFKIKRGDRIAQIMPAKVVRADFEETDSLSETKRGAGGFGSSGRN